MNKHTSMLLITMFAWLTSFSQPYIGVPYPYSVIISEADSIIGEKGIDYYSKLIKQNPSNAEAWYGKGMAYAYLGDSLLEKENKYYKKARQAFSKAAALKKDFAESYFRIGLCYEASENEAQADNYFSEAIRADSSKAIYYYYRGTCRDGKNTDLADYSKAIDIDKNYTDAYLRRAYYYLLREGENLEKALSDYSTVIRIDPKNITFYCLRARVKALQNDWPGALMDYDTAISINSCSGIPYEFRGEEKLKKGDKTGACEDWYIARSLNSQDAWYYIRENCPRHR